MKNLALSKKTATDVVTQDVELLEVNVDAGKYARVGWAIVIFGVLGFLIWASFAPLDRGVPLSGTVAVATNRKPVQHQSGGTVDEILVRDGDLVKAGQVLFRMNSTQVKANLEITRTQFFTAKAMEARLLAERNGASSIKFPEVLEAAQSDPRALNNMLLQQQLFSARKASLDAEFGAADESVAGMRLQLKGLEEAMVNKKLQQSLIKEQLDGVRDLAKEGFIAKNRLLELERTYAQVNGGISEDLGAIGRLNRQIAEMGLRKAQKVQDFQKEVRAQLAETQKEADSSQTRVNALAYEVRNIEVKAPVDGIAVSLNVFTPGAVIPTGFKLIEIVPAKDALIVEAQLPVHLVDKVHKGLKVDLIFSAFNTNTTPHIPGVITQVSADRTIDERSGHPYYKVKAEVAPEGIKMISKLQVRAGMPVDLFVKTGERTMMNYLFKPVTDRAHSALSED